MLYVDQKNKHYGVSHNGKDSNGDRPFRDLNLNVIFGIFPHLSPRHDVIIPKMAPIANRLAATFIPSTLFIMLSVRIISYSDVLVSTAEHTPR